MKAVTACFIAILLVGCVRTPTQIENGQEVVKPIATQVYRVDDKELGNVCYVYVGDNRRGALSCLPAR